MGTVETIVKNYARELGFDLVGIASAEPFLEDRRITLHRIREGLMDGLPWFTETRVRQGTEPHHLLPSVQSIISVGISYYYGDDTLDDGTQGRVARYAWGDDYHNVMKRRLKLYVAGLATKLGTDIRARWFVDDGPTMDRAIARRAGIGWFGKNTNILSSSHGSWIFLGQVLTDLVLAPDPPLKKTCGACVRCIDACPTGAITDPYVIDNRLCISHLTIENRGSIPVDLRPLMFDWIFGCDICQDVCPVNVKAMYSEEQAFKKKRFTTLDLINVLEMTEQEFKVRFANSPIRRAKLEGLKRNACVALGNSGDCSAIPALVIVLYEDTPVVRGHAAWALGRLGGKGTPQVLIDALADESDNEVRSEIMSALNALNNPKLSVESR